MKAKCHNCNNGCAQCTDGFIEITVGEGMILTSHCGACGENNGGRIIGPGLPPLTKPPDKCVFCGSAQTEWLPIGMSS